jgi:hypothetical protein
MAARAARCSAACRFLAGEYEKGALSFDPGIVLLLATASVWALLVTILLIR